MIFGIDFDNTISTNNYPYVGELIPMAKEVINTLVENGHTIMRWTVRGKERVASNGYNDALKNAIEFLEKNEIKVHHFNKSPIQPSSLPESSPKQLVDYFIDDISLGTPLRIYEGNFLVVDWLMMSRYLARISAITLEQFDKLKAIAFEKYPHMWRANEF